MCGLVGVVGTGINFVDVKVFKQLLFVDALRGPHSTGVAINGGDNKVQTYKRSVNSTDFLQLKQGDAIASTSNTDFLLGHNRYATQGAINDANAHPFTYGNVTLAHNGTLTDQTNLPDHKQFTVDSENIAYAMGLAEDPEQVISLLKGAFTLTWYNDYELKFYMVRNEERPMWIAHNKSRDVYYYASEKLMLEAILVRNNIEYDIQELPVGQLKSFSFDVEGKAKCSVATRKVKLQPKPKPKAASNSWSSYPSNYSYTTYPTLASNNLKVGEIVEFYSHGLPDVSESTKKGTLYGCITEGKKLSVKSYNQPNSSLAGYYTGLVTSMIKDNGLDTVVVRDPWLIEVVQGDTNNKGKEALINAALDTHLVIQTEQTHV
jgi:predicted glutamine amidotransferase